MLDREAEIRSALGDGRTMDASAIFVALEELLRLDVNTAEELAAAVLQSNMYPDCADVLSAWGALVNGDEEAAERYAAAAISAAASDVAPLRLLVSVYAHYQQWRHAAWVAQAAIQAGAGDSYVLYMHGVSLVQLGRASAGIPEMKRALELDDRIEGGREALFWARASRWRPFLAVLMAVSGLWAVVDMGVSGLLMLAVANLVLAYFAVIAVRARRWSRLIVTVVYAVGFTAGHFLLAPKLL